MVSVEVLDRTLELPTIVQVRIGVGLPAALHVNIRFLPSSTIFVEEEIFNDGGTEVKGFGEKKKINK